MYSNVEIGRRKPTRNNPPSTSGRSVSAQDNGPRRPKSRSSSPPSSKSSSSSFPRLSSEPNVARPETSQTTRSSTTYSNSQSSRGQNRKQGVSQAQFNSKLPAIYRKYGTLKPLKDDQIKSKFSPSKPQLESKFSFKKSTLIANWQLMWQCPEFAVVQRILSDGKKKT